MDNLNKKILTSYKGDSEKDLYVDLDNLNDHAEVDNLNKRVLQPEAFSLIANRFKTLSDPLRLRILHILHVENEQCVGDLVALLKIKQPSVSKHLKLLFDEGLISKRQVGTSSYYKISDSNILALCDLVCSSLETKIIEQAESKLTFLGAKKNKSA